MADEELDPQVLAYMDVLRHSDMLDAIDFHLRTGRWAAESSVHSFAATYRPDQPDDFIDRTHDPASPFYNPDSIFLDPLWGRPLNKADALIAWRHLEMGEQHSVLPDDEDGG